MCQLIIMNMKSINQLLNKTFSKFYFLGLGGLFLFTSCDTIIDLEEPPKGKIILYTDWSKRTEGISLPANYRVIIDNVTLNFKETSNPLPELEAGKYPIVIYNSPENITINGTNITVATTDNKVEAFPGWLFTSITQAEYSDFKEETITANMVQQVRQLSFEMDITGGDPAALQSVTATLTGVANGMDFKANTYSGTGLTVTPEMTIEGNKLKGSVRLIGLTSEEQVLTLDIIYTTGKTQQIISNISNRLSNFNYDKYKTITLTSDMQITNEAGFEATIEPWEKKESGGIAW